MTTLIVDSIAIVLNPMTARRIAALLVMLLMAHLDIARAYASCARDDTHHAADHAKMSHEHASMSTTPTSPAPDSSSVPDQAECCRAMASCVTSLALSGETVVSNLSLTRSAIVPSILGTPASLVFAPEPPPPRA